MGYKGIYSVIDSLTQRARVPILSLILSCIGAQLLPRPSGLHCGQEPGS